MSWFKSFFSREEKMKESKWREKIVKPSVSLTLGGKRPSEDPLHSCFGEVKVAHLGEVWPTFRERPLLPVCQLNLKDCVYKPDGLSDVVFLSVFMHPEIASLAHDFNFIRTDLEHRDYPWYIRTYDSLDGLSAIESECVNSEFKSIESYWDGKVISDYPTHDLLELDFDSLGIGDYYDQPDVETINRSKIGGWPSCVQSEPWWDYSDEGDGYEFVMQIENEKKAGQFLFGDGAAFIARSIKDKSKWAIDIQFT